ncbi:MAG: polyphosphate polymerase domain-containing protein [Promethearchaeota archaeon]|nr:MAG: polyphosphate polymerase domain-containing protein [Candidatus Lokiarchaeota archaeon]
MQQKYFNRFEIKYQLSMIQKDKIMRHIQPFMQLDSHVKNNHHYEVRSVYFDSPFKRSFLEKRDGIKTRIKLRIRYYPDAQTSDDELVFIELKKKINENVSKTRVLAPFKDAFKIIDNSTPEAKNFYEKASKEDKSNLEEVWYLYNRYHLEPVCVVCYYREPYMDKLENRFRITFDTEIMVRDHHFDLHDGTGDKYVVPLNICVMEVKFSSFIPNWAIKILQRNNVIQQKTSKFASGLARINAFSLV